MSDDVADRSDAIVVSWSPAGRAQRRLVFLPRAADGPDWERVEQVRSDSGGWMPVGIELVDTVAVERGGDEPTLQKRDPIADDAYRVLLDLLMVSDPWPLETADHGKMLAFLGAEASKRGYDSWEDAYHEFDPQEATDE